MNNYPDLLFPCMYLLCFCVEYLIFRLCLVISRIRGESGSRCAWVLLKRLPGSRLSVCVRPSVSLKTPLLRCASKHCVSAGVCRPDRRAHFPGGGMREEILDWHSFEKTEEARHFCVEPRFFFISKVCHFLFLHLIWVFFFTGLLTLLKKVWPSGKHKHPSGGLLFASCDGHPARICAIVRSCTRLTVHRVIGAGPITRHKPCQSHSWMRTVEGWCACAPRHPPPSAAAEVLPQIKTLPVTWFIL